MNTLGGSKTGANDDENYPVIVSAEYVGGKVGTNVLFTFNGTPDSTFQIELFDSPTANSSGFGEGKAPLTPVPITIKTDASGNATATVDGLMSAAPGTVITATATDSVLGNTSEFSQAVTVVPSAPTVDNVTFATSAHGKVDGVVLSFSVPLAPATVNSGNFELFSAGKHGALSTPIKLAKTNAVVYDSKNDTVTVTTAKALVPGVLIKAFVNGSSADPVTNTKNGVALDGEYTTTLPTETACQAETSMR